MFTGPNIVTNGLVLSLDAANTKSYPGSGTTWRDLSGNGNNAILVNGVSYNSSYNGSFVQNGSNNWISLTPTSSLSFPGNTSFSCELITQNKGFINSDFPAILTFGEQDGATAGGWMVYFYQNNLYTGAYGIIAFSRLASANVDANGGCGYNFISTADANGLYVWTYSYNSTTGGVLYRNGVLLTSNPTTGSAGTTSLSSFYIGRRGNTSSRVTNNNIYALKIYNRALSASEIVQNYNGTKSRFGL